MNSTLKNTIASITTAAVVATGSYLVMDDSSSNSSSTIKFKINWEEYIPNINDYLPSIPTVNIPTIELDLPLITIDNPNVDINNYIDSYDFDELSEYRSNYIILNSMIKDKRYLMHDRSLITSKLLNEWIKIYDSYRSKDYEIVRSIEKFRMISEVRLPKSSEEFNILEQNLLYYKSRGYDSVLVVFDGTESPSDLENLVKFIRYKGFRAFSAFSGKETLSTTIFMEPELFSNQLRSISKYCEGFIMGWRRTSAHMVELDDAYMNFIIDNIRFYNKSINIIGEIYYGTNAKSTTEYNWGLAFNIPKSSNLVMICNFGFSSVDINYVVKEFTKGLTNCPLIGLVVGHRPYYLSVYKNGFSQEKNQKIKEGIEKKFINAGCYSTITLHDDGRDNSEKLNNNLSSTLYTNLK